MSKSQREAVRSALVSSKVFKSSEAKSLEEKIFTMCKSLSKEYDDDVSDIYGKFALEKTGHLIHCPNEKDKIIEDIKNKILEWGSAVFEDLRVREAKDTAEYAAGMKISKGEFKCKNPRCLSDECYYYQEQTKSCDESATVRVVCPKCGHRYSFS